MNVLIIGLGSIANKHIDAIKSLNPNTKLFALRHSKNSESKRGVIDIRDFNELQEKPNMVILSNPTFLHIKTLNDIINYTNAPIFIEKPLFHTLGGVEEVIKKIEDKGIRTYIGCVLRFHPVILFIKKYLTDQRRKKLNEINVYSGSYLPKWRRNIDFKNVYSAKESEGGGVHLDLIHELDYIYWLFGKPSEVKSSFRSKSTLNINSVDYANYCLSFPSFSVGIVLNYYRRDSKRSIEMVFEDETISADLLSSKVHNNKGEIIFESDLSMKDLYKRQMKLFIQDENGEFNNIKEAFEILKICIQ